MKKILLSLFIGLSLLQSGCSQASDAAIKEILAASEPPAGVVFELAGYDDNGLEWAVPVLQSYTKRLRQKFPNIKLAVVSHGLEQFQLTRANKEQHAGAHKQVKSLVKDQDVEFHVCGNFASMMDIGRDDFVDFVSVAHRAPEQVKTFQQAGYRLVIVSKPR